MADRGHTSEHSLAVNTVFTKQTLTKHRVWAQGDRLESVEFVGGFADSQNFFFFLVKQVFTFRFRELSHIKANHYSSESNFGFIGILIALLMSHSKRCSTNYRPNALANSIKRLAW